jgi:hypothetical protein
MPGGNPAILAKIAPPVFNGNRKAREHRPRIGKIQTPLRKRHRGVAGSKPMSNELSYHDNLRRRNPSPFLATARQTLCRSPYPTACHTPSRSTKKQKSFCFFFFRKRRIFFF